MSQNFVLGVNYWPRKKAMTMWKNFDPKEIREDFEVVSDLGMTLVRIFLLWQDFQPLSPSDVDESALDNLEKVAEIALECGLKLDVTFFCGHMSGPNWVPNWLVLLPHDNQESKSSSSEGSNPHKLQVVVRRNNSERENESFSSSSQLVQVLEAIDAPYRNPFHDPIALEAQCLLIRKVVSRFVGNASLHEAIQMWNVGNEIDLVAFPRTIDEGVKWAELLSKEIRKCYHRHHHHGNSENAVSDDDVLQSEVKIPKITCGLHCDSLRFSTNNLPVSGIFSKMDAQVMHAYPMYVAWLKDPLNSNFVPFSCILTSILSSSSNNNNNDHNSFQYKPTLMEEFGGCTAHPGAPSQTWNWKSKNTGGTIMNRSQFMASEDDYAEYISQVLMKLHFCGASGAVFWCFADYSSDIWQEPPCRENYHERYFGLVRPDGTVKPHALVVKEFAKMNLQVRSIGSTDELNRMYRLVHESLNKNDVVDCSNWVKENSDENGSNEVSMERVFRNFQENILPQFYSLKKN